LKIPKNTKKEQKIQKTPKKNKNTKKVCDAVTKAFFCHDAVNRWYH
jgi:hypothetical protein